MNTVASNLIEVPLDQLWLDPQNPRLPLSQRGKKEEDVIDYMLREEGLLELMASIGERGYSPAEPLLVIKRDSGGFTVVEGNRRLAALKLLNGTYTPSMRAKLVEEIIGAAKQKPSNIPAIEYPSRDAILSYLGYRHITGIKQWDSLAKARYLHDLYNRAAGEGKSDLGGIYSSLARTIGSRADYVKRLLIGYKVMEYLNDEAYLGIKGMTEDDIHFSVLTTALNYENILKYVGLDSLEPDKTLDVGCIKKYEMKELIAWLFVPVKEGGPRVPESRALRDLNRILDPEAPEALQKFKSGATLAEALVFTQAPNESFSSLLIEAIDNLKAAKGQTERLSQTSEKIKSWTKTLTEISNLTNSLFKLLGQNPESSVGSQAVSREEFDNLKAAVETIEARSGKEQ